MRILLANKFYYNRGGDCTYTLNLERLLADKGHEVAVFSMDYAENFDTPWREYFPPEVSFRDVRHPLEALLRPLGSRAVRSRFARLLDDFRPDVVHLGNIHSQLSPVLAELAHGRGIRVVWTLHDYKLICPSYSCLRGGQNCTECLKDVRSVVRHRCVKGSLPASLIGYWEIRKWNAARLSALTDVFVCPSDFLRTLMQQGGFPAAKLTMLHNFIPDASLGTPVTQKEDYFCYVGRLSDEKGVATLLRAAAGSGIRLKVAGDGPLRARLEDQAGDGVEFCGRLAWAEVQRLVSGARALIIPSEWYENNPLSVIEALCLGTPVIGADTGGIPELIDETNGMLFESRSADSLRQALLSFGTRTFDATQIARTARARYGSEPHYQALMSLYQP